MKQEQVVSTLVLIYFGSPWLGHRIKTNHIKIHTVNPEICWMVQRLFFPPHFLYQSSRKIFFILYSINWLNFTAGLPLLLEILSNKFIVIICFPACDVITFKFNLIAFLSIRFPTWPRNSEQKFKYLQNKTKFYSEKKNNFMIFKKLLTARNHITHESISLKR